MMTNSRHRATGLLATSRRHLLAYELDDDVSLPRTCVELEQHDLLPRSECQPTIHHGNRHRGAEQRGANMAGAVVVSPAEVMAVFTVPGREPFEDSVEIGDRPRFEFDRRHAGGRAYDKDRRHAIPHTGMVHSFGRGVCYIVRVVLPGRVDLEGFRRDLAHVGAPMIEQE